MASKSPVVDEIAWQDPTWLYRSGGVHDNTVLYYFAESPFFDQQSNNALLVQQGHMNQKMMVHLQTRAAFEARLKSMSGLEFMVVKAPEVTAPGMGTGVWVIAKQTRAMNRETGKIEVTPHAHYYVVGDVIFMAPSLADVLNMRMVSAPINLYGAVIDLLQLSMMANMSKFISIAEKLPDFSPALGHTYPSAKANRKKEPGQLSKENTPMPDAVVPAKQSTASTVNPHLNNRLLAESLAISAKFDDEYMDELPVTGQPGDFHLATKIRVETNNLMIPGTGIKGPSTVPIKPATVPTPLTTDIPPATRKESKSGKSPKTPGSAAPKTTKRRKSKAPGSGLVSPT